MPPEKLLTRWLGALQAGDAAAAQQLWERWFGRLTSLARARLQEMPAAAEQEGALSAFESFYRHAQAGTVPQLADQDSLWRILLTVTARKAGHLFCDAGAATQTGGATALGPANEDNLLDQLLSRDPTPEFAAQITEEYRRFVGALANAELAAVALWCLEGDSVAEIAARLGYAPRSIKRKLQIVRGIWEKESAHE
jgi:DNA-directed RNA polymerase specialized sigma24 family protein